MEDRHRMADHAAYMWFVVRHISGSMSYLVRRPAREEVAGMPAGAVDEANKTAQNVSYTYIR